MAQVNTHQDNSQTRRNQGKIRASHTHFSDQIENRLAHTGYMSQRSSGSHANNHQSAASQHVINEQSDNQRQSYEYQNQRRGKMFQQPGMDN